MQKISDLDDSHLSVERLRSLRMRKTVKGVIRVIVFARRSMYGSDRFNASSKIGRYRIVITIIRTAIIPTTIRDLLRYF